MCGILAGIIVLIIYLVDPGLIVKKISNRPNSNIIIYELKIDENKTLTSTIYE